MLISLNTHAKRIEASSLTSVNATVPLHFRDHLARIRGHIARIRGHTQVDQALGEGLMLLSHRCSCMRDSNVVS